MSYVDTHLLKDEIVIYRTLLHWKVFIIPLVFAVIVLAIFVLVAAKSGYKSFNAIACLTFWLRPAALRRGVLLLGVRMGQIR